VDDRPKTRTRLTFGHEKRLVRGADFDRVYRRGNRAKGSLMTVALVPNGTSTSRLGLSIGKRVWKGAVRRNRVRRMFREAFRLSYPDLPEGVDLVVIGSVPGITPRLADARAELVRLAAKALRRYRERHGDVPPAPTGPPEQP